MLILSTNVSLNGAVHLLLKSKKNFEKKKKKTPGKTEHDFHVHLIEINAHSYLSDIVNFVDISANSLIHRCSLTTRH